MSVPSTATASRRPPWTPRTISWAPEMLLTIPAPRPEYAHGHLRATGTFCQYAGRHKRRRDKSAHSGPRWCSRGHPPGRTLARDMSEQPATLQGVTVAEAASILGVSTATVRRMVKRGQLEGQRVIRPQGSAFLVMLPVDTAGVTEDATLTRQEPGVTPRGNASAGEQL